MQFLCIYTFFGSEGFGDVLLFTQLGNVIYS